VFLSAPSLFGHFLPIDCFVASLTLFPLPARLSIHPKSLVFFFYSRRTASSATIGSIYSATAAHLEKHFQSLLRTCSRPSAFPESNHYLSPGPFELQASNAYYVCPSLSSETRSGNPPCDAVTGDVAESQPPPSPSIFFLLDRSCCVLSYGSAYQTHSMSTWHYYGPLPRQSPCCHHRSPHIMRRTRLTKNVTDIHGFYRSVPFPLPTSNLLDCSLLRQQRGGLFEARNLGISLAVWICGSST
jgi:hypothetical protein